MKRVVSGVIVIAALVFAGTLVSAQAPAGQAPAGRAGGGAPQPAPTNLQVLPKDWTRAQVVPVMQRFNAALGVTCAHCHVWTSAGDPSNDYASDVKPTKTIARAMLRMTQSIQPQVNAAVSQKPADQVSQVGCATCHRGAITPVVAAGTPGAPPAPPAGAPGAAPAGAAPAAPGAGRGNP